MVNINTKRHGKAAAIALLDRLEGINSRRYGEPMAVKLTKASLDDFMRGYGKANSKAQAGFRDIVGEIFACMIGAGSIDADTLSKPNDFHGPLLTGRERSAHERVWLKR